MYPPEHHLDNQRQKAYSVIERFPFATLISSEGSETTLTQVPLMLEKSRGKQGVLIGHMDRNNPHITLLNDRKVTVIFNGPNCYISPSVYQSSQLPTWNSVSVHVTGHVRISESVEQVRDAIIAMTETLEGTQPKFELPSDHPTMLKWLHYIVGFEIEIESIVGRYKLSQDKSTQDMELAKEHLLQQSQNCHRDIVELLLAD